MLCIFIARLETQKKKICEKKFFLFFKTLKKVKAANEKLDYILVDINEYLKNLFEIWKRGVEQRN